MFHTDRFPFLLCSLGLLALSASSVRAQLEIEQSPTIGSLAAPHAFASPFYDPAEHPAIAPATAASTTPSSNMPVTDYGLRGFQLPGFRLAPADGSDGPVILLPPPRRDLEQIPPPVGIPVSARLPLPQQVPQQTQSQFYSQQLSPTVAPTVAPVPDHALPPVANATTPMTGVTPTISPLPPPGNSPPFGFVPNQANIAGEVMSPGAVDPYCLAPGAVSGMNVRVVPFERDAFLPTPTPLRPYNPAEELATYRAKYAVPVQRPWVEFWRPFYTPGIYPPAPSPLGKTNLLFPHFYVYGDYRTAVGVNRNQAGDTRSWAHRLNLDMDLQITATERIHGFMGPLDKNNQFTRLDFTDDVRFETVTDAKFDTLYFEGDAGAITGGLAGIDSPFDLPFTFGLVPLLYQNGIWMEDAALGAAFAIPSRNSPALGWSNFDATFFAIGDQLTSDAFKGSNSAASALGTAWFIDAYNGYIELDFAYVHDDQGQDRSYNNFGVAYTRRYLTRLSNSVRFISNFGQDLPAADRTADGYLVLVENSLISSSPNTLVPYCNFFYGSGRPQSVARAAGSGGILRNTGINFETDGLTGYPTLDPTAANTYGAALGVNLLGANFRDQLVVEAAALGSYGNGTARRVAGDQYATGVRYQRPLSHRWLLRMDTMYGFLRNERDIVGSRMELRWKF